MEIHRTLFDGNRFPIIHSYFGKITYHREKGNPCRILMSCDETYIYFVAHAYIHYSSAGTGLRALIDYYFFLRRYENEMDFELIKGELQKNGIVDFESKLRNPAKSFLFPETLSSVDAEELDYFIFSGVYGTGRQYMENRVSNWKTAHPKLSSAYYLKERLILTDEMADLHPFYSNHPKLRFLLAFTRPIKAIVTKPNTVIKEIRALKKYESKKK